MPASPELRRRTFFEAAPFVLLPAILIIPALTFVSICPPSYGLRLAISIALVFATSELWGVIHMLRCFIGKWDLTAIGAILGSVIGGLVLLGMLFIGVLAMHPR
jgi:hypothetical protein